MYSCIYAADISFSYSITCKLNDDEVIQSLYCIYTYDCDALKPTYALVQLSPLPKKRCGYLCHNYMLLQWQN